MLKKKEWYAKVKANGNNCGGIACDACPFSSERGSTVCDDVYDKLNEGFGVSVSKVCKHIMAKLEKKWAKKAEKLKELGGGI